MKNRIMQLQMFILVLGNIYKNEKQLWDIADVFYKKALKIFRKELHPDKFCNTLAKACNC